MSVVIRSIEEKDNPWLADLIRSVMPEFGASGEGFAIHDKEVGDMFNTYIQPRSAYFVCEENGKLLGGGGVAPLEGGDADTCELKKMYFFADGRRRGLGQMVLDRCLEAAKEIGFTYCYLETFNTMVQAMKLYERNGFEKIPGPCGSTGHFACDTFYQLNLRT